MNRAKPWPACLPPFVPLAAASCSGKMGGFGWPTCVRLDRQADSAQENVEGAESALPEGKKAQTPTITPSSPASRRFWLADARRELQAFFLQAELIPCLLHFPRQNHALTLLPVLPYPSWSGVGESIFGERSFLLLSLHMVPQLASSWPKGCPLGPSGASGRE